MAKDFLNYIKDMAETGILINIKNLDLFFDLQGNLKSNMKDIIKTKLENFYHYVDEGDIEKFIYIIQDIYSNISNTKDSYRFIDEREIKNVYSYFFMKFLYDRNNINEKVEKHIEEISKLGTAISLTDMKSIFDIIRKNPNITANKSTFTTFTTSTIVRNSINGFYTFKQSEELAEKFYDLYDLVIKKDLVTFLNLEDYIISAYEYYKRPEIIKRKKI